MSLRVRIVRKLWDKITDPAELDDIYLFYGFHASNENCTYLLEMRKTKGMLKEPLQVPLKMENMQLLGWGFIQDPKYDYISFENFKTQTHVQDILPNSVMLMKNPKHQNEVKVMRINELKLEKVPFTIVQEGDRIYDKFLEEQKNLAMFTDNDVFAQRKEYPVTKRDMITDMLSELKEKMSFLERHGKDMSDYPDFENALDLAEEGLYGRAGFYLRLVQKNIEDDVVRFRYKDKYERLLREMKDDIASLPTKEQRPDLGDTLGLIEQLVEMADSLYYSSKYKEAHSKLFRAHEHLLEMLGRPISDADVEEPAIDEEDDLSPILTMEEFESDVPMFDPTELKGNEHAAGGYEDDIEKRIDDLERKRKDDPYNKWVMGELGDAYFEAGDIHNALESYKTQLKRTANNPILLNNIGMIYKLQFNYKTAMEYFKRAVEQEPNYADAYYNLGFLYFEEGDLSEAIYNYTKALEINPDFNLARDSLNVANKKRESFMRQQNLYKKDDKNDR
ncbi:MAG TPA: tetratricopeptide repeat protein [Candidatus Methanofastidiosa archaeon]|nr:tetratricopeptide repeat protein [Candidatus Methanofastidiosa archaeon]